MNLQFDMQEISYIAGVIAERPYKEVASLIKKLEAMVNAELAKERAPSIQPAPTAEAVPAVDTVEAK